MDYVPTTEALDRSCFAKGRTTLESKLTLVSGDDLKLLLATIEHFQEAENDTLQGPSEKANYCHELALMLDDLYSSTGDDIFWTKGINIRRELLSICPPGHPKRAQACSNVAGALYRRFHHVGEEALLLEAISLQREALSLCPSGHPIHVSCCGALALYLVAQYESAANDTSLLEAIDLQRHVLSVQSPEPSDHAIDCMTLADSLHLRYSSTNVQQLLTEAIALMRRSRSLFPSQHPGYGDSTEKLATLLRGHYENTHDTRILGEAIDLQRELLVLRHRGHPERAFCCMSLANTLHLRFSQTNDDSILTEIIALQRETLALCGPTHPGYEISCRNLAGSLWMRYHNLDAKNQEDNLLVEITDIERKILDCQPPGHLNRVGNCRNLGAALRQRFQITENDGVLAQLIEIDREFLSLHPQGVPARMEACINLASSLSARYVDDQTSAEIIALEREILSLCPPGHEYRAQSCGNLAGSLRILHRSTGDVHLMKEALELDQEAFDLRPIGHPDRAISCMNLAISLLAVYESGNEENTELLAGAIDLQREAIKLRTIDHEDLARSCVNLAYSLRQKYSTDKDVNLLLEAIQLGRESLKLRPPGHPDRELYCFNLALSLKQHFTNTHDEHYLKEAIDLGKEGMMSGRSSAKWRHACSTAELYLEASSTLFDVEQAIHCLCESLTHHPDSVLEAASSVMAVLNHIWDFSHNLLLEHYDALIAVYQQVIRLITFVTNPALESYAQLKLMRRARRIGYDAFVNAALGRNWKTGLEELELTQGIIWSQTLHYREPQLQDVPPHLARQLQKHLKALVVSSSVSGDTKDVTETPFIRDLHNQAVHVHGLLRKIRGIPGLERFMLGETYESMCSVASAHPVVVLVEARSHSYALILALGLDNHASLISLDWRQEDFEKQHFAPDAGGSRGSLHDERSVGYDTQRVMHVSTPARTSSLNSGMRYLWTKLVKPILTELGLSDLPSNKRDRTRLHWCPTGMFTRLPLHAAGIYDGSPSARICCADHVVSSYTPTLTALLRCQKGFTSVPRRSVHLALVAEEKAHEAHLPAIPGVLAEVSAVLEITKSGQLGDVQHISNPTTITSTCAAMQAAHIVHLACHGVQDSADALQSGFCLGDGRLTISSLMNMRLDNGFLAFLSACETAKGDKNQPDQLLHLGAAMLFAGFNSVVATMWAISDIDGPIVAKSFYQDLFNAEVITTDTIAFALDQAVAKLRTEGTPLHRWVPFIHMGA